MRHVKDTGRRRPSADTATRLRLPRASGLARLLCVALQLGFGVVPARAQSGLGCTVDLQTALAGTFGEDLAREVSLRDGAIVRLNASALQRRAALADNETLSLRCYELHWGFMGNFALRCSGGALSMVENCVRARCPWHHFTYPEYEKLYVSAGADVSAAGGQSQGAQWAHGVLAGNGMVYAAPSGAASVLRINGSSAEVAFLSAAGLGQGSSQYSTLVLGYDGHLYGIPLSASQVLHVDTEGDGASLFGNVGGGTFKWAHGVLASTGWIYGIPSAASSVLWIDPFTRSAGLLPGSDVGSGLQKWVHGVLGPSGEIFGIPGNAGSVLRIDPRSQTVSTFGSLGAQTMKWSYGLLGIDGKIYGVPASATAVLRVDPGPQPSADASLGSGVIPAGTWKWQHGVQAHDGLIYCIPRSAEQVLRIDPLGGSVELFGALGGGTRKWQQGVLAPDGLIYAAPADAPRALLIDPLLDTTYEEGPTMIGDRKYAGLVLVPSGAVYAVPARANQLLHFGTPRDRCRAAPLLADGVCILGRPCEVVVTPAPGRPTALGPTSGFWIAASPGGCSGGPLLSAEGLVNPMEDARLEGGGRVALSFGVALAGAASGPHALCWISAVEKEELALHSQDVLELGSFTLQGPQRSVDALCTLGMQCNVSVSGSGLAPQSWVLLASADGPSCKSGAAVAVEESGLRNPTPPELADEGVGAEAASARHAGHSLGMSLNATVGMYRLCWVHGNSSLVPPEASAFVVELGQLLIAGPSVPSTGAVFYCWAASPCSVTLSGVGLAAANRVSLRESCEDGALQLPGLANPAEPSQGDPSFYHLGVADEGRHSRAAICWHGDGDSRGVLYGYLALYGSIGPGISAQCTLGLPCNISLDTPFFVGRSGGGLNASNRVVLASQAAGGCPGAAAPSWGGRIDPYAPASGSDGLSYALVTPVAESLSTATAMLGSYAICWSPAGAPGTFRMRVGELALQDRPCAVPGAEHAASLRCRSLDTGVATNALRHGESCTPLCTQGFTSSQPAVYCSYGSASPAFECKRRCYFKPRVASGLDHGFCVGLADGEVCNLRCLPGTTKSGYLLCRDGVFIHQAEVADRFLFDAPRCYRACDASSACGAAGANLAHGGSCAPQCPAGSSTSVSLVFCRDGALQPESFGCLPDCQGAPVVPNSVDLSGCAGLAHGARCPLRCRDGFVKSGDPVCQRGAWTAGRCYAPCSAPEVRNASVPSCAGLSLILHGSRCQPSCAAGFAPTEVAADLSCSDGILTPSTFECRASCLGTPFVDGADAQQLRACAGMLHGEVCPTPCSAGYAKTADLVCSDGRWTEALCLQECSQLPTVLHAPLQSNCSYGVSGDVCEIRCNDGFQPSGKAVCERGAWSTVLCLQECTAPSQIDFAATPPCAEGFGIRSGEQCTSACGGEFEPSVKALSCQDGVLTPPAFACQKFCGDVSPIKHAVSLAHCPIIPRGEICTFDCATGYRPSGNLVCSGVGWRQQQGATLVERAVALSRSLEIGRLTAASEFVLSFGLTLRSRAVRHYRSVLHITATGKDCCEPGDRLLAVMVAPRLVETSGAQLHFFFDGGVKCSETGRLELGRQIPIAVRVEGGRLSVAIDGLSVCEKPAAAPSLEHRADGAVFYAGSPWLEPADAEIARVTYLHAAPEDTLPACEPRRCSAALPAVVGADPEQNGTCAKRTYGAACAAFVCPAGAQPEGRFVCSAEGEWEPEGGAPVRCVMRLCPALPPAVDGAANGSTCAVRAPGSLCLVRCGPGRRAMGGFACGGDGRWAQLPGAVPACESLPCEEPPVVPLGLFPEACRGLASGESCEPVCVPPQRPVWRFRCEARLWTEVGLCVDDGPTGTSSQPAVVGGLSLEPSVEIQPRFSAPADWASRTVPYVVAALRLLVSGGVSAPIHAHLLGVAATSTAGARVRRLQGGVRPETWRISLVYAITAGNAQVQEVAAAVGALSPGDLGSTALQTMPQQLAPQALLVAASAPRLLTMPGRLAEILSSPDFLGWEASAAGPETTTAEPAVASVTQRSFTVPPGSPRQRGPAANAAQSVLEEGPWWYDVGVMTAVSCIPLIFLLVCFLYRRWRRNLQHGHSEVSHADYIDYTYCSHTHGLADETMSARQLALHVGRKEGMKWRDSLKQTLGHSQSFNIKSHTTNDASGFAVTKTFTKTASKTSAGFESRPPGAAERCVRCCMRRCTRRGRRRSSGRRSATSLVLENSAHGAREEGNAGPAEGEEGNDEARQEDEEAAGASGLDLEAQDAASPRSPRLGDSPRSPRSPRLGASPRSPWASEPETSAPGAEDPSPAEEHAEGQLPVSVPSGSALPPHERQGGDGGDRDDAPPELASFPSFFDFPKLEEMVHDWRPVRPFYASRKEDKEELQIPSATPDDKAGNVVKAAIKTKKVYKKGAKKEARLELRIFSYSVPVRSRSQRGAGEDDEDSLERPGGSLEDQDSNSGSAEPGDDAPKARAAKGTGSSVKSSALTSSGSLQSSAQTGSGSQRSSTSSELSDGGRGESPSASSFRASVNSGRVSMQGVGNPQAAFIRDAVARARESPLYKEAGERRQSLPDGVAPPTQPSGTAAPQGATLRESRPVQLAGGAWSCASGRGPCGI